MGEAAVLASVTRLPHRTILERLAAQACRDRDHAAVAHLRARAALYVAHVALAPHLLGLSEAAPAHSRAVGSKAATSKATGRKRKAPDSGR